MTALGHVHSRVNIRCHLTVFDLRLKHSNLVNVNGARGNAFLEHEGHDSGSLDDEDHRASTPKEPILNQTSVPWPSSHLDVGFLPDKISQLSSESMLEVSQTC